MLKRIFFLIISLVVIVPVAIFVARNSHSVTYDYWLGQYETYAWLPVLAGFVLGVLGMLLFFVSSGYLWKARARSLEKQLNDLHYTQQKQAIKAEFDAGKAAPASA